MKVWQILAFGPPKKCLGNYAVRLRKCKGLVLSPLFRISFSIPKTKKRPHRAIIQKISLRNCPSPLCVHPSVESLQFSFCSAFSPCPPTEVDFGGCEMLRNTKLARGCCHSPRREAYALCDISGIFLCTLDTHC